MSNPYQCILKEVDGHKFVLERREGIRLDIMISPDGRIFVFILQKGDKDF